MAEPRILGAISVDHPPDNSDISNVNIEEGGPPTGNATGFLCRANGTATVPNGHTFVGVFAKVVQQDPGTSWTRDQLVSNAGASVNVLGTGGAWNLNQNLTALCSDTAPYPDNWFLSVAVTEFFDAASESYVQDGNVQTTYFKGKYVSDCAAAISADDRAEDAKREVAKLLKGQIRPKRRAGGWLLYRLSTSLVGPGNVLMLNHTEPLRASVLALSAQNVHWEHKVVKPDGTTLKKGTVRRAVGDLIAAPAHFFVANAPQYALLAMQETASLKPFTHVIASEDRKRPDYVHVNPGKDIRVQVNYNPGENVRTGTFDLWVKVIA